MSDKLNQLKTRLARVADLSSAANVLEWDQETHMPEGGADTRADQVGTLRSLAHQYFVDEEVGQLFEDLSGELKGMDYDSNDASLVRVGYREYQKLIRVPTTLIEEMNRAKAQGVEVWRKARANNDFKSFQPNLERIVDLQKQYAACFNPPDNLYDALVDYYEPGMSYASINAVFGELKPGVVALVKAISENQGAVDDSPVRQHFDFDTQMKFSAEVAEAIGYSFKRGRLDLTTHPFMTSFSQDDARITTRVNTEFLPTCLMGVIHETGHALYEQGVSPSLYRLGLGSQQVLGTGTSMAMHESQSRFYENVLGRSRSFWKTMYPRLQAAFPQMKGVTLEAFYRALNKSQPSLIRVEADEVTYGLHIMLRFELENDLINDRVKVKDLPREWNDRMEAYLGVRPSTDSDGVLQDIHWSSGLVGYFPDYLLGSILSVQWHHQMIKDRPEIPAEVEAGKFDTILAWLRENVHQHGLKFTMPELVKRVTGGSLQWQPYMQYLETKYAEIYGL